MEKNTQEDMQTSFVGLLKAYQAMAYDEGYEAGIMEVKELDEAIREYKKAKQFFRQAVALYEKWEDIYWTGYKLGYTAGYEAADGH